MVADRGTPSELPSPRLGTRGAGPGNTKVEGHGAGDLHRRSHPRRVRGGPGEVPRALRAALPLHACLPTTPGGRPHRRRPGHRDVRHGVQPTRNLRRRQGGRPAMASRHRQQPPSSPPPGGTAQAAGVCADRGRPGPEHRPRLRDGGGPHGGRGRRPGAGLGAGHPQVGRAGRTPSVRVGGPDLRGDRRGLGHPGGDGSLETSRARARFRELLTANGQLFADEPPDGMEER